MQVVQVKDRATGEFFAAKVLEKKHIVKMKKEKYVMTEREVLRVLGDSPFMIKLHCTFQDNEKLCACELGWTWCGALLGALTFYRRPFFRLVTKITFSNGPSKGSSYPT